MIRPFALTQITSEQLAGAFAEWDRRFREEPARFQSDVERILAGESPEDYGESCAPYLAELLGEQGATFSYSTPDEVAR